jgi:hypothetical protein
MAEVELAGRMSISQANAVCNPFLAVPLLFPITRVEVHLPANVLALRKSPTALSSAFSILYNTTQPVLAIQSTGIDTLHQLNRAGWRTCYTDWLIWMGTLFMGTSYLSRLL